MGNASSQVSESEPSVFSEGQPNFFSQYSVTLPIDIKTAYRMFGTAEGHKDVTLLSSMATNFALKEKDAVSSTCASLADAAVRTASPCTEAGDSKVWTRQHFRFNEVVPLLFMSSSVAIEGTLTWDQAALDESGDGPLEALYESISDKGVVVWKLRRFSTTPGPDGKPHTTIEEHIKGYAPKWVQPIVQRVTTQAHRQVITISSVALRRAPSNTLYYDTIRCLVSYLPFPEITWIRTSPCAQPATHEAQRQRTGT